MRKQRTRGLIATLCIGIGIGLLIWIQIGFWQKLEVFGNVGRALVYGLLIIGVCFEVLFILTLTRVRRLRMRLLKPKNGDNCNDCHDVDGIKNVTKEL